MADTLPLKADVSASVEPREYNLLKEQARTVAKSGLAPKNVASPEKVLVIGLKGRELGIPMMQALSHINIVEGKPTISAELMVALVQRAGHKLRVKETTAEQCVVEGVRSDDPDCPQSVTWTMEDAKKAGVASRANWKNYPQAMLRARAISALCRFAFADVLMGASYTPEEIGDSGEGPGEVIPGDPEAGRGDAWGSPAEAREPAEPEEHFDLLDKIEELLPRVPADQRPDKEKVLAYARQKIGNARQALAKLKSLVDTESVEEAEVVEEPEAGNAEVPPAKLKILKALADDVYGEEAGHLEGHQWLQREMGRPLEDLPAAHVDRWIEKLQQRWDEMRVEDELAEEATEAGLQ